MEHWSAGDILRNFLLQLVNYYTNSLDQKIFKFNINQADINIKYVGILEITNK